MSVFAGKHWVVTGGGSGMGLASARLLHGLGAAVALWDLSPAVKERAAEVGGLGVVADVTVPESVEAATRETLSAFGKLDGVLHAAGVMKTGLVEALDGGAQARVIQVNLAGTAVVAHAVVPHLKRTRGSLVLFGSVSAFHGTPEFAAYAASKAGVLSFAQALRVELEGAGVHVGVFCPHFVETPMIAGENRGARFVNRRSVFVTRHEPDAMARAVVRGIEARRFLIVPTWRERLIYAISRYGAFLAHGLMKRSWRA
ncbi:MAG: SDR family oxidoreductase [Gemmataceae bacterium]